MSDSLDRLLGIDLTDPIQRHANDLVDACHGLIDDLDNHRTEYDVSIDQVSERMGVSLEDARKVTWLGADLRLSTLRRYALAIGADITFIVTPRKDVL